MLKLVSLLGLLVACQAASVVYHHPAWWGSSQYKSEDGVGNYAFGYHDGRPGAPSFHRESGDASGTKVGSYGVHDADGTVRVVDYVADHAGFRANVKKSDEAHPVAAVVQHAPVWTYGHPLWNRAIVY